MKIILELDVVLAGSIKFTPQRGLSPVKKGLRYLNKKKNIELYVPMVQRQKFADFSSWYFAQLRSQEEEQSQSS